MRWLPPLANGEQRLDECGIDVVDAHEADEHADVPLVLLICPGVFETPEIVDMFKSACERQNRPTTLRRSTSNLRGSRLSSKLARHSEALGHVIGGLMHHQSRGSSRDLVGARKAGASDAAAAEIETGLPQPATPSPTGGRRNSNVSPDSTSPVAMRRASSSHGSSSNGEIVIRLYSTERSFAWYMNGCPKHLREAGFFNPIYSKWPASWVLQEAAASKVAMLAKVVERPAGAKAGGGLQHRSKSLTGMAASVGSWRPLTALDGEMKSRLSHARQSEAPRVSRFTSSIKPPKWQTNAAASAVQAAWRGGAGRRATRAKTVAAGLVTSDDGAVDTKKGFAQVSKETPAAGKRSSWLPGLVQDDSSQLSA